jgi:hypothetical protein
MKTTLVVPDALYRQAKLRAAARNVTLRDLFVSGLQRELAAPAAGAEPAAVAELAAVYTQTDRRRRQPGSVGSLQRDTLHERGVS